MKNLIYIILSCSIILGTTDTLVSQQNEDYRFYYDNHFITNPAAISKFTDLEIGLDYLRQFSGVENAPTNILLSGQTPIPYQNLNVGVALLKRSAGLINEYKLNLSGSYKLNSLIKTSDYLAVGMSFNINSLNIQGADVELVDKTDPLSIVSNDGSIGNNVGLGVFYSSSNSLKSKHRHNIFQFGFAFNKAINQTINLTSISFKETRNFNGYAGMIIPFNEGESFFQPSVNLIYEGKGLANVILSSNLTLNNALIVGVAMDTNYDMRLKLGYRFATGITDGFYKVCAYSVLPLGRIGNQINSGYGVSLFYEFYMGDF